MVDAGDPAGPRAGAAGGWQRLGAGPFVIAMIASLLAVLLALGRGLPGPDSIPRPAIDKGPGETSIGNLLDALPDYDGRDVVLRGEVIGDVLHRGQYAWVNIADSGAAIGVWVPAEMVGIRQVGNYRFWGDQVRVYGAFRAACPEHGGDTDLHATRLEIVKDAEPRDLSPSLGRWTAGAVLLLAGAALGLLTSRILR